MDDNLNPYDPAASPPSDAGRTVRRIPRAAVAGGLVAALALAGTGLAFAAGGGSHSAATPGASGSSSTTQPASRRPKAGPFAKGRFGFGGPGLGRGLRGVVHGTFTLHGPSGYRTVEVQIGQVTNVSPSSITVKSSDGYTHTYAVQSSTVVDALAGGISSVVKGDQIELLAGPGKGGADTAFNITDSTRIAGSGHGWFGFGPASGGSKSKAPQPPSGTSSSGYGGWSDGPGPQPSGQFQ